MFHTRANRSAPTVTSDQGTLATIGDGEITADPETVRRARQIATRLAMPRPRRDPSARRGAGELASLRYRDGSDDIDLARCAASGSAPPPPRSARWPPS